MAIRKPSEMDFQSKGIVLILYGAPGVGKTTLALSAPKPVLIDTDNGIARVAPQHRKDTSSARSYTEIMADIEEAATSGQYETCVVDTIGALLDAMTLHLTAEDPKLAQKDGTLSLKGYGALKQLFLTFSNTVRAKFKNTVFVLHETSDRDNDGNPTYSVIAAGSAKTLLWQPADLAGRVFMDGNKRYIGFTPTEQYYAKGAYGIRGLYEIPDLSDGAKNNYLEVLFSSVRTTLINEKLQGDEDQIKYNNAMQIGLAFVEAIEKPEDVQVALDNFKGIKHCLTSDAELKAALKRKMSELSIVYNRSSKAYEFKQ